MKKPLQMVTVGDINFDFSVQVESISGSISTLTREGRDCLSASIGGGGVIFSVAAKNAGFDSRLIGRVGKDAMGDEALRYLKKAGIRLSVNRDENFGTGKILIFRDKRDGRAMISHRGANVMLTQESIPKGALRNARYLYVSGYALLERPQSSTCLDLIKQARGAGTHVILDIVPHRVVREGLPSDFGQAIHLADVLILEEGTARRLLGVPSVAYAELCEILIANRLLVILRPGNDFQTIISRSGTETRPTGYSDASVKLGYLDALNAKVLKEKLAE